MSRDDGFRIADTDTGMMADPKVLALARRHRDPMRTAAAVALYDAVRLASWKACRRLTLDETAPGWWLEPVDDMAADLAAVGLLDAEHRIPEHAWRAWFVPALDRYLDRRRRDIFAGLVSRGMAREEANAEADRRIADRRLNLLGSTYKAQPTEPYRTEPYRTEPGERARDAKSPPDSGPESPNDPFADPEREALVWLARHGCDVRPGNGYHRHLVTMVESYGVNAVIGMFDRLADAGTKPGDVKGYVFGARDALDAPSRPKLADLARIDRADDEERAHRARLAATRRLIDEYRMVGNADGSP